MSKNEMRVIKLIAQALDCKVDSLSPDSRIGRHESWDSLGQMKIITALEKYYEIIVDEYNIDQLLSVEDICHYLESIGVLAD